MHDGHGLGDPCTLNPYHLFNHTAALKSKSVELLPKSIEFLSKQVVFTRLTLV